MNGQKIMQVIVARTDLGNNCRLRARLKSAFKDPFPMDKSQPPNRKTTFSICIVRVTLRTYMHRSVGI